MGRLSGTNSAAAQLSTVRPVHFVQLAFPSGTFRFHTWAGLPLTYNSQTYTCDGSLVGMSSIGERADSKVPSVTLTLSSANAHLAECFSRDAWHFGLVTIAEGFLTESLTLYAPPTSFGSYFMSAGEWSTSSATFDLVLEPVSIRLRRMSLVTSSNADQQARYNGDTYFKFSAAMESKEIAWGGHIGIVGSSTPGMTGVGLNSWGGSFGLYGSFIGTGTYGPLGPAGGGGPEYVWT